MPKSESESDSGRESVRDSDGENDRVRDSGSGSLS